MEINRVKMRVGEGERSTREEAKEKEEEGGRGWKYRGGKRQKER